jgi:hypothetical protein
VSNQKIPTASNSETETGDFNAVMASGGRKRKREVKFEIEQLERKA